MTLKIELADISDLKEIMELYHSVIGTEGCSWNEYYPDEEIIREDIEAGTLYCAKNNEGNIISAFALSEDEEVDELECWSKDILPVKEIMRLVVKLDYQNQGIARIMLQYGMDTLKEQGYEGVHFLVSKGNQKAIRSYSKLNFMNVGETTMFDNEWYCYEKKL